jgi:hypothetical protein
MKYVAECWAENGASHVFEFWADNNELAGDHVFTVILDPHMHTHWASKPEGTIGAHFRRHYAEKWHSVR